MADKDQRIIYLCECGKYEHYADSIYCSECSRKIDRNRKNALAEKIEPLLAQWREIYSNQNRQ